MRGVDPVGEPGGECSGAQLVTGEGARGGEGGDDRRDVADRVAPAAVHLDRGQHDVGGRRDRRARAGGDDCRARAGGSGRHERRDRRRGAALVAAADDEAAGGRVERELERLDGDRAPAGQPGGPPCIAQHGRGGHRGMLGGPTTRDDDGTTRDRRLVDRGGKRGSGSVGQQAARDPRGQGRLRSDHLLHRPRWAVSHLGHREVVPGIGCGGEGCVGVEGAERAAEVVHPLMVRAGRCRPDERPSRRDGSGRQRGRRVGGGQGARTLLRAGSGAIRRSGPIRRRGQ